MAGRARSRRKRQETTRFGVGEWYGSVVSEMEPKLRAGFAAKAKLKFKAANMPCPFKQSLSEEGGRLCNKNGGVCSLIRYRRDENEAVVTSGKFVTVCPNRFWQDANVFRWIGETVLGTSRPVLVSEVEFLESVPEQTEEGESEESDAAEKAAVVGRIDLVLMNPEDDTRWCAVELQSVYFSGRSMGSHLAQFKENLDGLPWPDATRRPDWRSSGPKRLMPQLMTKIPTLRRWGRRMCVVVDTGFFAAMGQMRPVPHLSNADILWFVVDYEPKTGAIELDKRVQTTLEDSVEGLTAGIPLSREEFEGKLDTILKSMSGPMKRKVLKLA